MTQPLKTLTVLILLFCSYMLQGQKPVNPADPFSNTSEKKPYKILTSGKRITIQAQSNINSILVWTSVGHRIVEQTRLNIPSYSFDVTVKENIFFLMIEMVNGKRYTEKIGVK